MPNRCRYLSDDGTCCNNDIAPQADIHLCDEHSGKITNIDVAVYTTVIGHYKQDLREFFTRSNFYLVAVAALLAAFFSREDPDQKVSILIAAMGLVLSLFWLCVAVGAVFWIGQWRSQAETVSRALDRRFDAYSRAAEPHKQALHKKLFRSPEGATTCLPGVFAVGWLIVLLFTLM
jgi:hypothetical protein